MRIYDTQEKKWMPRDEFFLSCYGDLYHVTKGMFGNYKMKLVSSDRYVTHSDTGVNDRNGVPVFEGDICDAMLPDKHIQVTVAYVPECGGYKLFDYDNSNYYDIWKATSAVIEVIGNVFDGVKADDSEEQSVNKVVHMFIWLFYILIRYLLPIYGLVAAGICYYYSKILDRKNGGSYDSDS